MSYQHNSYDRDRGRSRDGQRAGGQNQQQYQPHGHQQPQQRRPYNQTAPQAGVDNSHNPGSWADPGESYSSYSGHDRERVYDRRSAEGRRDYEKDRPASREWKEDMYSDRDWDNEGAGGHSDSRHRERDPYSSHGGRGGSSAGDAYKDRDRPNSRTRSASRSRSHSRSRGHYYRDRDRDRSPFYGAPPCRDVILEGFGFDISEDDIMAELVENLGVEGVEAVSVIKDRNTGQSRGFGFARFTTIAQAKKFLENHYPTLRLFEDGTRIKIAFSRSGGIDGDKDHRGRGRGREGDDEWNCRVCMMLNFSRRTECYRCGTPKSEVTFTGQLTHPTPTFFQNDGSRDIEETTVSQFLLLRDLSEGVTEEILAKGVMKLLSENPESGDQEKSKQHTSTATNPSGVQGGAAAGSIKRVLLVRDRRTGESWRFGFVEFSGVEHSKAAFEKYNKMEKFTIASRPVSVSFIHSGVFVPVYNPPANSRNLGKYTFLGSNNGARLAYWDEEGYVSELAIAATNKVEPQKTSTKDEKTTTETATTAKGKKRKAALDADKISSSAAGGSSSHNAAAKKAIPSHLQFWQDRHLELHGVIVPHHGTGSQDGDSANSETDNISTSAAATKKAKKAGATSHSHSNATTPLGSLPGIPQAQKPPSSSDSLKAPPPDTVSPPPMESFADLNRIACLLCVRQFKSVSEVHKHERVSSLHRQNMANESLVNTAREKLAKAGVKPAAVPPVLQATSASSSTQQQPAYRDRAKERRAVFGQPKRPENSNKPDAVDSSSSTTNREPSPPPQPSKGEALLSKMGWTSGAGLGVEGKGITAPVVAEMYAEGVGLGAKGGKVGEAADIASMNTGGGYKDFVRRTKEKAKERYEGLS